MGLFDDLKNVTAREETPTPKSDVEKVLDIETKIIEEYQTDIRVSEQSEHYELYRTIYLSAQEKIKNITLTLEILQNYIFSRENTEETKETLLRGMYSAFLLETICRNQPELEIIIDGRNKRFNYLFYNAHYVKKLKLNNIKGDKILAASGANGGEIEQITLTNIVGDWILHEAGSRKGSAKYITCSKIEGNHTLSRAGNSNGTAENIICTNIFGNGTFGNAADEGKLEHVTCVRLSAYYNFGSAGNNQGRLRYIICSNSGNTFDNAGENSDEIEHILLNKEKRNERLTKVKESDISEYRLEKIELSTNQTHILTRILILAGKAHTLSFEEQKKAHDEIAQLQEEIFAGET